MGCPTQLSSGSLPMPHSQDKGSGVNFVGGVCVQVAHQPLINGCHIFMHDDGRAVMRTLECEHTHESHHQTRGTKKTSCSGCYVGTKKDMRQPDGQMHGGRLDQQGWMYAATTMEAVQDAAIITCTLLFYSTLVVALFDSGSTHTFIAKTFIDRIGVFVKDLGYDLVVSTPIPIVLTIEMCVRGVVLVIQHHILLIDFTVLPMWEFEAIFGILDDVEPSFD